MHRSYRVASVWPGQVKASIRTHGKTRATVEAYSRASRRGHIAAQTAAQTVDIALT